MKEARKTDKGFLVIDLNLIELNKLGGNGCVCDSCNDGIFAGVFIGVLGCRTYCKDCFKNWHDGAIYYREDAGYEKAVTDRTLLILNTTLVK